MDLIGLINDGFTAVTSLLKNKLDKDKLADSLTIDSDDKLSVVKDKASPEMYAYEPLVLTDGGYTDLKKVTKSYHDHRVVFLSLNKTTDFTTKDDGSEYGQALALSDAFKQRITAVEQAVPSALSDLNNDTGFITASDLPKNTHEFKRWYIAYNSNAIPVSTDMDLRGFVEIDMSTGWGKIHLDFRPTRNISWETVATLQDTNGEPCPKMLAFCEVATYDGGSVGIQPHTHATPTLIRCNGTSNNRYMADIWGYFKID